MKRFIILLVMSMLVLAVSSTLSAQEPAAQYQQPPFGSNPSQQNANPNPPTSQTPNMNRIGYVDVSRVFDEYSKTKQSKAELDKEIKVKEEKVREMETELRQMRAEFENREAALSDEVKAARIKEKSDQIQNFTDQAEEELSKKESQLTEDIVGEIYAMINSVGEKEGFSLILDKSNLIYGHKSLDLTDRILKELETKK